MSHLLVLVKHSLPELVPDVPAREWHLSDEGRLRCKALAERLRVVQPQNIVASLEPKAMETAQIVSEALGAPWQTAEGLHEHERSNVGWLSKEQLEAGVADFFARPAELVMGRETANQAHDRFSGAVAGVVAQHPDQNVVVVTHGTVITLYVSRLAGVEPFAFWKRLGLPSFVALSLPDLRLQTVVEDLEVTSGTEVG